MIYAGVDVAKADHVIGAVDDRGEELGARMPFKNSAAGFERCEAWLEGVAEEPSDVLVGMEATGHYWMALYAFLVSRGYSVAVIDPLQVRAVRRFKGLDRVKNDRVDAALIAEALRIGQYDPTRLATDEVQSLRTLTRYQQSLKAELAEVKTQCTCLLDSYFPEFAGAFSDPFGAAARAVLSRSPLPSQVARRRVDSLQRDVSGAARGSRRMDGKAAELKELARHSVGIRLGEAAAAMQVRSLVRQMDSLDGECAKVEGVVRGLLERIEPLVLTIPGVSYTTGAQIVAEIGDVSRFRSASALVSYAGLNSSVNQSGKFDSGGGPITKHGSPYLRRALWLAANRARQYDPALRSFYERKRAEGKCHRVAVTAVARKLCHIVFAVMRDGVPYDPARPGRDRSKHSISGSQGATKNESVSVEQISL
jgi:transposase